MKLALFILTFIFSATFYAQKNNKTSVRYNKVDLSIYPSARDGYKRVYINLPIEKNEDNLKVEIFVGKQINVDCNIHNLIGELSMKILDGYGYDYFEALSNGDVLSTKMLCIDEKLLPKYITMPSYFTRYNSNLPIVVYIPKDMELKYKVWKTTNKLFKSN
jgi:ecotin